MSRRAFVLGCSAAVLAVPLVAAMTDARATPAPLLDGIVRPRSEWAGTLPVPGPLPQEAPGDVRFLIVHHTASTNRYGPADVPAQIRSFHSFHTGPDKGWPDVAYNFFIDRYGVAWEGRAGSLAGPVKPDATGGSQGFAQICCFIGDHTAEAPTPDAQQSMVLLLAGLSERYGVNPSPGAKTTFVSRGSNKWPAGAIVTTSTIAGHRDMSLTTCPGDAAYPIVKQAFPVEIAAVLASRAAPRPVPASESAEPTVTASPSEEAATPLAPAPTGPTARGDVEADGQDGVETSTVALIAGGVAMAGAAAGLAHHAWQKSAVGRKPSGSCADISESARLSARRAEDTTEGTSD